MLHRLREIVLMRLVFLPGSDQVQLLERNARQMLGIVDATFPGPPLEERYTSLDCMDADEDIQKLACNWKQVSRLLKQQAQNKSADITELKIGLLKVSPCYPKTHCLLPIHYIVLKTSPEHYE